MTTTEAPHPWDDDAMTRRLLQVVPLLERQRLDAIDVGPVPGIYLTFFASPRIEPLLGRLVAHGMYPSYVGVAAGSLRERIGRHRRTVDAVDGIDEHETYIAVMPCASTASARWAEAALIAELDPLLNGLGFGARPPGPTRRQRCSAFDALLPGRPWAQRPTRIDQARAQLQVVSHLARLDPSGPRWPALVPGDAGGPAGPRDRRRHLHAIPGTAVACPRT